MSTLLLGSLIAVGATLAAAATAAACSIAAPAGYDPIRDPYKEAKIAITGNVATVRRITPTKTGTDFVATVHISRVFKGKTGPALRVRGKTDGASCGFGQIKQGEAIALLLSGGSSPFLIAIGSRTSFHDLEIASHGRSHRPGDR